MLLLSLLLACEPDGVKVGDTAGADTDTTDTPTDCVATDEVCNGVDDDCDGLVDDDDIVDGDAWYADADGDGYGDPFSAEHKCAQPEGYVDNNGDCDDTDALQGGDEVCDDRDNDCDGLVDGQDDSVVDAATWYLDADDDGYGDPDNDEIACSQPDGYVADATDCDDGDAAVSPGEAEVCDEVDNDCNGGIDDAGSTWYADMDRDGYGDEGTAETECDRPTGYIATGGDCDDTDADVSPAATEICNGIDDDCDGLTDGADGADGSTTFYADADEDGYGDPGAPLVACEQPSGYVADDSDCDDTDADVGGGASGDAEICDDRDNDCDGLTDGADSDATGSATWYADDDRDGWGDPDDAVEACDRPTGYIADDQDCDDTDAEKGGPEVCDDVDNDCDGLTDGQDDSLDGGTRWYADADEDGYGDPDVTFFACNAPSGYVDNANDCDDTDASSGACAVDDDGSICASLMGTDEGVVPTYTGGCDTTAGFSEYGDHCYYAVASSVDWPDARATCLAAGGYLATVADSDENDFIYSLNSRPHVGGCDADTEGTWTWVTGEAFSFEAWSPGEPNDMGGEDCVEVLSTGAGWNDIWCTGNPYTAGYVCEFEE